MTSRSEQRIDVPETLSSSSVRALAQAIDAAVRDNNTEAVVLQGGRETFCKGLDFEEIAGAGDASAIEASTREYCRCLTTLRFSNKPTVALVRGAATGGGVGLVAACDLVLASESASFALPEVLFGFAPGMVLPFLLERMPRQTVRLWALTAIKRTAKEAFDHGLIDQLVSDSVLEAELRRWLKLLRRGHRRGISTVKQLCAAIPGVELLAGVSLGQQSTFEALREPEIVRGIQRFMSDGLLPWEAG
jgi:enoyl-CoA hydratase/carnithine racemase